MSRSALIPVATLVATFVSAATPAVGAETVTYRYDARGRLVKVQRSGSVNNGVVATYASDKADNRTAKQVTGAP